MSWFWRAMFGIGIVLLAKPITTYMSDTTFIIFRAVCIILIVGGAAWGWKDKEGRK